MQPADIDTLVLEAVEEIQTIKCDTARHPDYALLPEVHNFLRPELPEGFEPAVLSSLRTLYRRGIIEHHRNVNGIPMFGINHHDNENNHLPA